MFLSPLLWRGAGGEAFCQTYPVQLSTQLVPPYSGYLPDYSDPSAEKLKVILQFNDFSVAQYNLKLKFEIKGNGFTLSTKTFYNPPPISLLPGQPLLLSSIDLAPYLNSNNLDFVGINQNQYEQRMALPEGYYSICVKAYDYYNNTTIQVSNEACALAWFTLSDPPFLNLPLCNSVVKPQEPQNVIFQWTPMNLGSPLSAMNTEYEFALWEMRPDSNANPNQLVLSTTPVFSTTTQQTFINYGITETPLNLYMKYVWRVKVKDNTGRDWFKNNGYSQICTFTYGNLTNVIGDALNLTLNAQTINHRTGQCDWTTQSAFTNYLLQVRKQGTVFWFDYPNSTGIERVSNLEPNTTYECRVRGDGNNITGAWSNIAYFTTASPPNYSCNDQSMPINNLQAKPLPLIKAVAGLVIQSGQFEVVTTQIEPSGPPGWYKGKGYALVFGALPVAVKWTNIYIDEENRQQQGVIEALTDGIDKWLNQWDITTAEENATYVNGIIDTVFINGNQVCYSFPGNNNTICVPTPTGVNVMVIRDAEGNQYAIQLIPPPPKITGPTNYLDYSADVLEASENEMVYFSASANQKFGFDKKEYAGFIKNYEAIKLSDGKNYFVSNKSIGESQTDEVIAEIQIVGFNLNQLSFKTNDGTLLTKAVTSATNQIKITGIPANAGCVYAWYNNKKIGKLNVYNLKAIAKKLVVVPVGSASLPNGEGLRVGLNGAFKQANVTWSVTTAPNFTFDLGANGLEAADATIMSKYSAEMRALRNAYKNFDILYDKEAYYLFVIPNFNTQDLKGYMVRGRAVGFVSATASVKEIAHELAHGAFALEHTFPKIEKSMSNNLMDYNGGTQLVKEQWDLIQDFKSTFNWFDNEEDGSYLGSSNTAAGVFNWINKVKVAYKNNTTIRIPGYTNLIGRSGVCYLGGTQYDSICVYLHNHSSDEIATIRNNVVIGVKQKIAYSTLVTYSCILVDGGKIVIEVPAARLNSMLYYIKNTQTFKNLILFVNGYRPIINGNGDPFNIITTEYVNSNNQIEYGDSRSYWKGIDAQFMNRIGTRTAVYADGHHSVATANHFTTAKYSDGNLKSLILKGICDKNPLCAICLVAGSEFLHTNPRNDMGFTTRKNSGKTAAQNMLAQINDGSIVFNKTSDTLDIVAHSMGYAYAVGMIEELQKANIHFGRCYIIAPENACGGGCDWSKFTEVWQYGSNLGEANQDPVWDQDGVAPQCAVTDIEKKYPKTTNGRVFIPKDWKPKGFLDCHTIANYGWIFTERTQGKDGYVKPR